MLEDPSIGMFPSRRELASPRTRIHATPSKPVHLYRRQRTRHPVPPIHAGNLYAGADALNGITTPDALSTHAGARTLRRFRFSPRAPRRRDLLHVFSWPIGPPRPAILRPPSTPAPAGAPRASVREQHGHAHPIRIKAQRRRDEPGTHRPRAAARRARHVNDRRAPPLIIRHVNPMRPHVPRAFRPRPRRLDAPAETVTHPGQFRSTRCRRLPRRPRTRRTTAPGKCTRNYPGPTRQRQRMPRGSTGTTAPRRTPRRRAAEMFDS